METIEPHDIIYLQWPDEDDLGEIAWRETTWSADKVYKNDLRYLLTTPEREAAPELLGALQFAKSLLEASILWTPYVDERISPAIARAAPPDDVADGIMEKE